MLHRLSRALREEMVATARTGRTRLSQALLASLVLQALLLPFLAPKATKVKQGNEDRWGTLGRGGSGAALAPQALHQPFQAQKETKGTRETMGCKELKETRAYQA